MILKLDKYCSLSYHPP